VAALVAKSVVGWTGTAPGRTGAASA